MKIVLILGLIINAIALPIAGHRIWFLYRVIRSGQPAPERVGNVKRRLDIALKTEVAEVFGQKKLLKWTVPGAAHFFVFWAFVILASVYLEAYGALFSEGFAIPFIGHWPVLGFLQDFIAVMAFISLVVFAVIRLRNSPDRIGRRSRFKGSHLGGAWVTLLMIFNVIWSMFLFRGAAAATGNFPYKSGAFVSLAVGNALRPLGHSVNHALEGAGLLIHIGVMLTFLILVLHSKHLHIFLAPINVLFGRRPLALGAMKPMTSGGQPVNFEDLEEMDENMALGVGRVEEFTWKGILDFATCTECGRCQSQCPAWNTDKPLSPKLLIMNLRDHAMHKAPYLLADPDDRSGLPGEVLTEVERPLVGATEGDPTQPSGGAVIDNDVLWSCTSCGACVNQCPVDIEHVDHIMDMRRHQVLVESNFPTELNGLFRGLETKGNPWNMAATARMEWAQGLDFPVRVVGEDVEDLSEVEWLFWVGCAGAYEDRAKKTTRAVAELLNMAGVEFAVLGNGETCTGDPARRAGNEFVFQGLAAQNAETLKEHKATKVVATCAHCFNTLKNEYDAFGAELEVVHHTQLLNRLVREKKLTPVAASGGTRAITYHDPCYLGRHNQVYTPPRELLEVIPDASFTEMPRSGERSFCCGAGGARMWMEESIGERINVNRTREAVATGADQIAVGCPFCRVMLADGLVAEQSAGNAREELEVLDVAQLLLASVKGEAPVKAKVSSGTAASAGAAASASATAVATKDEPETGDVTQSPDTVSATSDVGPNAKASGGSSLFDDGPSTGPGGSGSLFGEEPPASTPAEPQASAPTPAAEHARAPEEKAGSLFDEAPGTGSSGSGSLFGAPAQAAEPEAREHAVGQPEVQDEPAQPEDKTAPEAPAPQEQPAADFGGSLFDVGTPAPEVKDSQPAPEAQPTQPEPAPAPPSIPQGVSLFDVATPEPEAKASQPAAEAQAQPEAETAQPEQTAQPEPEAAQPKPPAGSAVAPSSIPEGVSLFDVATPEPETRAARPEAPAQPEPETAQPEPQAAQPEPQPAQPGPAAGSAVAPSSIPEGVSLFDVATPEPEARAAQPETQAQPEPGTAQPEPQAAQPEPQPAQPEPAAGSAVAPNSIPEGVSLFDVKEPAGAKIENGAASIEDPAAGSDGEETGESEPESEAAAQSKAEEAGTEPPQPESPKPGGSSDTHQPKTDADISGSRSLFDL